MKTFLKLLSVSILFFTLSMESFALDAPTNLKIDSSTDTSVNLSWDFTENAFVYYVAYSQEPGIDGKYEMYTEFVESTSIEINDLEIASPYYFSVVAVDENGEESTNSNEVIFNDSFISTNDFTLNSIKVLNLNKIELDFNELLDNSDNTFREFKIVNKNDDLDKFEVINTELNSEDSSKLQLTLDRNTEIGNEYEVVIIAITSIDGKNIESGIDNIEIFTVDENITNNIEDSNTLNENITNNIENNNTLTENIDLNAAAESIEGNGIAGNETENLDSEAPILPETGAGHILVLILSIILGTLIFIFKYKKETV